MTTIIGYGKLDGNYGKLVNILDKEEFRIKLEEINHLVEQKDYKGAMNVVDSIDWRRVKNVRTLCVVGEIYAANKRYEDSKEIFLLAYHRAPIGKNILYRLIEVSLKMGDIEEATEFYQEYTEVAPNDNTQYILKYKIYKEKKAPLSEQIKILEDYKEREFTEKWSYELAKLYYQAGDKDKCLDLCNEIILWFNEGSYVMRAMDLKMRMGALTGKEKERYEQQFVPKLMTPEEVQALKDGEEAQEKQDETTSEEKAHPEIESISIKSEDLNGVESLQDKISKGIRDIFGAKKASEEEEAEEKQEENSEVKEEMIKNPASEKEFENVPDLEPENGKPVQEEEPAPATEIKMPKLEIPESMKNIDTTETEVPKMPAPESIYGNMDEKTIEAAPEKEDFDFNLEDTILAAASAQGIEIPEEPEKEEEQEISEEPEAVDDTEAAEEPEVAETVEASETIKLPVMKKRRPVVELEEEEFLTEEDLQQAEAEFLNGPSGRKEAKTAPVREEEIPRLEDEEIYEESFDPEEDEMDEDELIAHMLKESIEGEDNVFAPEPDDEDEYEEEEEYQDEYEEEAPEPEENLSEEEKLEQFIDSIQPKDNRDPMDIVPRKKELTDNEKKLFTYFVKVPGMKEQLVEALYDVQMAAADKTSRTGNIIVMGGRETGKTRLIGSLIPAICQELNMEASKVAYVFADQINGKDITKIVGKLAGGFLVIENANQLTQETVEMLDKAMEFRTDGLTVILEDEKIGMRKLIARFPKFAKKFTSMINIPVFTNDELVNFARVYTKENGFRIEQMGMLALYNLIGINQKEDEPMNIGAVKDMLDAAMAKSQGGLLKFNKKKRVDRDGFIVLYEKDFAK